MLQHQSLLSAGTQGRDRNLTVISGLRGLMWLTIGQNQFSTVSNRCETKLASIVRMIMTLHFQTFLLGQRWGAMAKPWISLTGREEGHSHNGHSHNGNFYAVQKHLPLHPSYQQCYFHKLLRQNSSSCKIWRSPSSSLFFVLTGPCFLGVSCSPLFTPLPFPFALTTWNFLEGT